LLAADIRLLKQQIAEVVRHTESATTALGRFDDLEARVVSIDDDLRELARSYQAQGLVSRPLPEVLERGLQAFRRRTHIDASLKVEGDFTAISDSQRIALVRTVQEALSNVRQHSGAGEVRVCVTDADGVVRAEVIDDGRGFSVEPTLIEAARRGRLGLVGMAERIRMLGGTLEIDSRAGGPTRITVELPEWRPAGEEVAHEVLRAG
jgi:signal transduction histidine kinase